MTLEQAKEELPNWNEFWKKLCDHCIENDLDCPDLCPTLEKSKRVPFISIQEAYARHDGELWKVARYINQHK